MKKIGKFLEIFKKRQMNIPFAETLEKMPNNAIFIKNIIYEKKTIGNEIFKLYD